MLLLFTLISHFLPTHPPKNRSTSNFFPGTEAGTYDASAAAGGSAVELAFDPIASPGLAYDSGGCGGSETPTLWMMRLIWAAAGSNQWCDVDVAVRGTDVCATNGLWDAISGRCECEEGSAGLDCSAVPHELVPGDVDSLALNGTDLYMFLPVRPCDTACTASRAMPSRCYCLTPMPTPPFPRCSCRELWRRWRWRWYSAATVQAGLCW